MKWRRIALTPVTRRDAAQEAFLASIYAEISDHPELIALRKTRQEKRGAINALDPVLTPIMEELPSDRLAKRSSLNVGAFCYVAKPSWQTYQTHCHPCRLMPPATG